MRSYPVKENPIDSAVSGTNIQTHKQIDILLLYYKDNWYGSPS